jgi:hypothetical protein
MALVRVKLDDGTETSVGESLAASHNLKVLDKPATRHGRTLRAKYPVDLRGKDLDAALDAAGLSKAGTAQEKRTRLSDHQTSPVSSGGDTTHPSGSSASTTEESA